MLTDIGPGLYTKVHKFLHGLNQLIDVISWINVDQFTKMPQSPENIVYLLSDL